MCPFNASFFRRPASLHRVRAVSRSPASSILSGRYDFLPPVSPRFVSFVWRYHPGRLVVRFHRPKTSKPVDLEVSGAAPPQAALCGGGDRISQVPGEPPLSVCHVLRLRQDGWFQTSRNHHTTPATYTTKAPTGQLSKLYSMASGLAVYASPQGSPLRSARLASECGSDFPGRA